LQIRRLPATEFRPVSVLQIRRPAARAATSVFCIFIATRQQLETEIAAWQRQRNVSRARIKWMCPGRLGGYAFVTQNGWDLNMVNDAGQASRAWVEHPGRIWIQQANQGAIYSPTGLTIQFDRGTIWRRGR
jgi:hypothetical protein